MAYGWGTLPGESTTTTISVPKKVQPFNGLTLLKRSILGEKITSIPEKAYYYSSIETIIIPNSVTSIDSEAFRECTSLTSIIFKGTITQWNAITKNDYWNAEIPATVATCTDGDVNL